MPTNPISNAASSSSTKVSTKTTAPVFDVAGMIAEISTATAQARSANAKMRREVTALVLTSEDDQKKLADSNRVIEMQKNKAKLQSQQTLRNVAKSGEYEQMLVDLTVKQTEYMRNAVKQMDDVAQLNEYREGKGGFLGFIGAGLRLPGEQREADRANKAVVDTANMIQTIEASTTSTAKTLATLEEVHTEATVQAMDDVLSAKYQIDKAARLTKLTQTNAVNVTESFNLTATKLELLNRMSAEQRLTENTRLAQEQIKQDNASAETLAEFYNITADIKGETSVTPEFVKAMISVGVNSEQMGKIREYATKGVNWANKNPKENAAVAGNPIASYTMLSDAGDLGVAMPTNRNAAMEESILGVHRDLTEKGIDVGKMPQDSYNAMVNKSFISTLKEDRKLIKPGGGSTASAPQFTVLAKNKAVRESPLYIKFLSKLPMADASDPVNVKPIDEQRIWDSAVAAIAMGKAKGGISLEEAVDSLSAIFQYANEYDSKIGQYEQLNAEPPTTYNSYLTTDKGIIPGFRDQKEVIDLTDRTKIMYGLLKSVPKILTHRRSVLDLQAKDLKASEEGAK